MKADFNELKKGVTSLYYTDLSTFFDEMEDPPLRMDVAVIPNEGLIVYVPGDGGKEIQEVSTP